MAPSTILRRLLQPVVFRAAAPKPFLRHPTAPTATFSARPQSQPFSSTTPARVTFNQIRAGCRKPQPPRKRTSPALRFRPQMQGVCLRVSTTKPKKPNSGERKTCRVRLSNGREVSASIPGAGHNIQQHNIVIIRGGRAQDCPGVRYKCVRGAQDLGGVANRLSSRSKFGTKKAKGGA